MNKHTPGPWRWDNDHLVAAEAFVLSLDQEDIGYTSEADARLIAAAPDLLDVAKWALDSLLNDGRSEVYRGLTDTLRAAIAKAEGVQS